MPHDRGIPRHFCSNLAMVIPITVVLPHIALLLLWISHYHVITIVPITVQVSVHVVVIRSGASRLPVPPKSNL